MTPVALFSNFLDLTLKTGQESSVFQPEKGFPSQLSGTKKDIIMPLKFVSMLLLIIQKPWICLRLKRFCGLKMEMKRWTGPFGLEFPWLEFYETSVFILISLFLWASIQNLSKVFMFSLLTFWFVKILQWAWKSSRLNMELINCNIALLPKNISQKWGRPSFLPTEMRMILQLGKVNGKILPEILPTIGWKESVLTPTLIRSIRRLFGLSVK